MPTTRRALSGGALSSVVAAPVAAQRSAQDRPQDFLLTVFLHHDESKTLTEINAHLNLK